MVLRTTPFVKAFLKWGISPFDRLQKFNLSPPQTKSYNMLLLNVQTPTTHTVSVLGVESEDATGCGWKYVNWFAVAAIGCSVDAVDAASPTRRITVTVQSF